MATETFLFQFLYEDNEITHLLLFLELTFKHLYAFILTLLHKICAVSNLLFMLAIHSHVKMLEFIG